MTRTQRSIGLAAAALVIVLALVAYCRPKPAPIPRAEQKTIDSLDATRPAFDSSRAASVRIETLYVARSAEKSRTAGRVAQVADSLRDVANALQRAAEAERDTSSQWYGVATARKQEADSLRVANGTLVSALADQVMARTAAQARATAAETRLLAVGELNARLAEDVRAGDRCRVLYVASCPSRKVAAIGGVVVGALAVALIDRRP